MKAKNFRKRALEVEDEDQDQDHEKRCAAVPSSIPIYFELIEEFSMGIEMYAFSWDPEAFPFSLALSLEEVKFLQRQREKKSGIPALPTPPSVTAAANSSAAALARSAGDKNEGEIEKDDLVLQDTFAQETAVMVEDPNMYVYHS